MKKILVGIIMLLGIIEASSAQELSKDGFTKNKFLVLKDLVGEWFRWEDNPKVFDTWVAPGIISDDKIWSGISLSETTLLFAARSKRDGKLWNLHVFEFLDIEVKLFSYNRGPDGIMSPEPVKTLDAESSNNSSIIWRESKGNVMRFQFSGVGKSLRMSWDTWDKVMGVWNRKSTPFRRDPPPSNSLGSE